MPYSKRHGDLKNDINHLTHLYTTTTPPHTMASIKTLIIGQPQVGKKTFITKHILGHFDSQAVPDGTELSFKTSAGIVTFQLYVRSFGDVIPEDVDATIVMFDHTQPDTIKPAAAYVAQLSVVQCVVVCGMKVDINRWSDHTSLASHLKVIHTSFVKPFSMGGLKYFDISSKNVYNYEKPFITLLRNFLRQQEVILNGAEVVDL